MCALCRCSPDLTCGCSVCLVSPGHGTEAGTVAPGVVRQKPGLPHALWCIVPLRDQGPLTGGDLEVLGRLASCLSPLLPILYLLGRRQA